MKVLFTFMGTDARVYTDLPIIPNIGDVIFVSDLLEAHDINEPKRYDEDYEPHQIVTERDWHFERNQDSGEVEPCVHLLLYGDKPEEMPQERWDQLSYVLA